ncbi:MAG: universal stress protein [Ilumatobacteraceae bacterium]
MAAHVRLPRDLAHVHRGRRRLSLRHHHAAGGVTGRSLKGELPGGLSATHAVVNAEPADALCSEAERLQAWAIVVGNKRVQSATRVLGSIPLDVAKHAPCNVHIVHTVD